MHDGETAFAPVDGAVAGSQRLGQPLPFVGPGPMGAQGGNAPEEIRERLLHIRAFAAAGEGGVEAQSSRRPQSVVIRASMANSASPRRQSTAAE